MKTAFGALAATLLTCLTITPAAAQEQHIEALRTFIANKEIDVYLVNNANETCRKVVDLHTDRTDMTRFGVMGMSNDGHILNDGTVMIPWERKIERLVRSDGESVSQRCLEQAGRRDSFISGPQTTDGGVPYVWPLELNKGFCQKVALYTNCRTECLQNIKRGSKVHAFVLTKDVAEQVSGRTCTAE